MTPCMYVCVCDPILLVLCVFTDGQFEKHGTATNTSKATSGHVVSETDDNDSLLSKLSSLKRKIFG